MAQRVNVLVAQPWWPELESLVPVRGKEWRDFHKLSSGTHVYTMASPTIPKQIHVKKIKSSNIAVSTETYISFDSFSISQ